MKNRFIYAVTCVITLIVTGCKKESSLKPEAAGKGNELATTVLTSLGVPQNSVMTVAGSLYTSGPTLINGPGTEARFNDPRGLQVMDDGTIYVADYNNEAIRVIDKSGIVSTFSIPKAYGSGVNPITVGVGKNGFVYITGIFKADGTYCNVMYQPDGSQYAFEENSFFGLTTLIRDPHDDTFWFGDGAAIRRFSADSAGAEICCETLRFSNHNFLLERPAVKDGLSAIFMGYNGVTYFTYGKIIYKRTPDGTGAPIFRNLSYGNQITDIVTNKDGRTIYIAVDGKIKRIDSGKLTTVAGPNPTYHDSRDGVGLNADAYAEYIALSKDESTLYFSDRYANAIRKIVFR